MRRDFVSRFFFMNGLADSSEIFYTFLHLFLKNALIMMMSKVVVVAVSRVAVDNENDRHPPTHPSSFKYCFHRI
jgi:alanine dehydrogenase